MPFIGNQPALSYTSFAKQDFTTSATTSYTLDHPVANENELALFINFVRQEAGTAYTASGVNLILSSATSASDDMYAIFLGKAVQTVNPPSGSVGISQLSATGTPSSSTFLRGDNSWVAAGGTNTPAFSITKNALQATSAGSNVLITWQATNLDTDSGVDLTNNKYVVPTGKGGNYFLSLQVSFDYGNRFILSIYKNGTAVRQLDTGGGSSGETALNFNAILSLAAADELTAYYYSVSSTGNIRYQNSSGTQITRFEGFKIIE